MPLLSGEPVVGMSLYSQAENPAEHLPGSG